jgi:DNA replication and repair protein RecN
MGDIMHELGTKMQVMAITHLPQIASKGIAHYYVFKKEENDRTITQIKQMDTEERVIEIARMLSGAALTEASMANARDLLGWINLFIKYTITMVLLSSVKFRPL